MIETISVITITFLLLAYFWPGKTPPHENPLTIERSGKYKITLAPRLNLAQPYIESLAEHILSLIEGINGSAIEYFVIRDNQVKAHGSEIYLLAICCINQMMYFYGANPMLFRGGAEKLDRSISGNLAQSRPCLTRQTKEQAHEKDEKESRTWFQSQGGISCNSWRQDTSGIS